MTPDQAKTMEDGGVNTRCPGCGAPINGVTISKMPALAVENLTAHYECGGEELYAPILHIAQYLELPPMLFHPGHSVAPLHYECPHVEGIQTYEYKPRNWPSPSPRA